MDQESPVHKQEETPAAGDHELADDCNNGVNNPWSDPPKDVLSLILDILPIVDRLPVARVCKAWRSIFRSIHPREGSRFGPPCLVTVDVDEGEEGVSKCSLFNPVHNERYTIQMPAEVDLSDTAILFSKGGWLLMSQHRGEHRGDGVEGFVAMFFLNPLTRARVDLPPFRRLGGGYCFTDPPTSPNCVVVLFGTWQLCFYTCRPGSKCWVEHESPMLDVSLEGPWTDLVFYGGRIYFLFAGGHLGVLTLDDYTCSLFIPKPEWIGDGDVVTQRLFLTEFDISGLLAVFMDHIGRSIRLFKIDPLVQGGGWTEVKSLGGHALFVGESRCIAAKATTRAMQDRIYFNSFWGEDCVSYSFATGFSHSKKHSRRRDLRQTKTFPLAAWTELEWWSRPSSKDLLKWH